MSEIVTSIKNVSACEQAAHFLFQPLPVFTQLYLQSKLQSGLQVSEIQMNTT